MIKTELTLQKWKHLGLRPEGWETFDNHRGGCSSTPQILSQQLLIAAQQVFKLSINTIQTENFTIFFFFQQVMVHTNKSFPLVANVTAHRFTKFSKNQFKQRNENFSLLYGILQTTGEIFKTPRRKIWSPSTNLRQWNEPNRDLRNSKMPKK